MEPILCPVCEKETDAPSDDSDWCSRCIEDTLLDQAEEWASDAKVAHQVI